MITKYAGSDDKDGQPIHEGDIIETPGSDGALRLKVVYIDEPGYKDFYGEEISNLDGVVRKQHVLLSSIKDAKIVARVK